MEHWTCRLLELRGSNRAGTADSTSCIINTRYQATNQPKEEGQELPKTAHTRLPSLDTIQAGSGEDRGRKKQEDTGWGQ
jgi:hypothetical protein